MEQENTITLKEGLLRAFERLDAMHEAWNLVAPERSEQCPKTLNVIYFAASMKMFEVGAEEVAHVKQCAFCQRRLAKAISRMLNFHFF